jgi:SET domain-containing protein 6
MTMIALKDIASGQQIYNDFGQLPRSDLLRRYGYITDNYKKWDVVEVDIGTITRAAGEIAALEGESEKRVELCPQSTKYRAG